MKVDKKILTVAIFIIAGMLVTVSQGIVTTAVVFLMRDFSITSTTAQWTYSAFLLVVGVMTPLSAFISRRFKVKTIFIFALSLFLIGSIIAYFSQSIEVLITGRVLQAIGNGIVMPYIQILIYKIIPEEKWRIAMGFFGLIIGIAPVCGIFIGGFIIDNFGWRLLFELFTIGAFILLIVGSPLIKNINEIEDYPLDVLSVILSIIALSGIMLGFTNIAEHGFISLYVFVPFIIGLITLMIFVNRQNSIEKPLLNLSVLKNKYFVIGTAFLCIFYMCMNGCTAILPVYFQGIAYHSATESAMINFPGGIMMVFANFVGGLLATKYGIKKVLTLACSLILVGFIGMATYTVDSSILYYTIVQIFRYVGFGIGLVPITTWAIEMVSNQIEDGTAVNNTFRQVFAAFGSSIFLVIIAFLSGGNITHTIASQGAFRSVTILMCGLIVILLLIAIFIIDDKAKLIEKGKVEKLEE